MDLEEIENLIRSIMNKEVESIIKNLPTKKCPRPDGITGEIYQRFTANSSHFFKKLKGRECSQTHESSITVIPKPDKDTI